MCFTAYCKKAPQTSATKISIKFCKEPTAPRASPEMPSLCDSAATFVVRMEIATKLTVFTKEVMANVFPSHDAPIITIVTGCDTRNHMSAVIVVLGGSRDNCCVHTV